jgi:hypothetical protein
MRTDTSFSAGWIRLIAATLLLILGQAAMASAEESSGPSNLPPPGFTALFNGRDLTGWRVHPKVKKMWSIEDGVLKSHGLLEEWGADLVTEKGYRDFVLMLDFRMPTISDSGISFRRLIPEITGFGDQEQFNLRSKGGMGHLESYYFLPKETAKEAELKEEEKPDVRHIDPEVGVWHTVKLTMKGRTFSAEYDGEVLYDNFVYHDWMLNMEPAPIRLQKHIVVHGDNLGAENPCPIEYRNVFIKELGPDGVTLAPSPSQGERRPNDGGNSRRTDSPSAELLARIDAGELPEAYVPAKHQEYVDRRMAQLTDQQRHRISQLWKEKQKIDPAMPNRGFSFVKILKYVAEGKISPAKKSNKKPRTNDPPESDVRATHEQKDSKPVNDWKWSAETDDGSTGRRAVPIELPDGRTIHVVPFGVAEGETPPVVLLPNSRLSVTGRLATVQPVYFGISINHPNGDFAGRFLTTRPANEFRSGKDFQVTLDVRDFQLDSSLAEMKDKLPSEPFHFVVESIWITTLEQQAGLEIAGVELTPSSEKRSK